MIIRIGNTYLNLDNISRVQIVEQNDEFSHLEVYFVHDGRIILKGIDADIFETYLAGANVLKNPASLKGSES